MHMYLQVGVAIRKIVLLLGVVCVVTTALPLSASSNDTVISKSIVRRAPHDDIEKYPTVEFTLEFRQPFRPLTGCFSEVNRDQAVADFDRYMYRMLPAFKAMGFIPHIDPEHIKNTAHVIGAELMIMANFYALDSEAFGMPRRIADVWYEHDPVTRINILSYDTVQPYNMVKPYIQPGATLYHSLRPKMRVDPIESKRILYWDKDNKEEWLPSAVKDLNNQDLDYLYRLFHGSVSGTTVEGNHPSSLQEHQRNEFEMELD
ncbi:hypothetical protein EV361DRAFT_422593 [Lentinula raphanica]|nr:hypothetical protein EV361DRAFT_422593 [Lentinula raphanica]